MFRSTDKEETRQRFTLLRRVLPLLLSIETDLCTMSNLQAMSDTMRSNPSFGLALLAVELDFKNVVTSSLILKEEYVDVVNFYFILHHTSTFVI